MKIKSCVVVLLTSILAILTLVCGSIECRAQDGFYVIPVAAMTFKGNWDDSATYNARDVVFYDGSSWFSMTGSNTGHPPNVSPAQWTLLAQKGDAGPKGDAGDTGPQGAKGDKGDTGVAGAQGIQGLKGDTGAQGPSGASPWGLNGTSTYYTQGYVGVGTSSPTTPFNIVSTSPNPLLATSSYAGAAVIEALSTANSGAGCGVYGLASSSSAAAKGVYGDSTGAGTGVYGNNNGSGAGVRGISSSGAGVYGSSTTSFGVYGENTTATSGIAGVYGRADNTTGTTYGVMGYCAGYTSYAVYGMHGPSTNYGYLGTNGFGAFGKYSSGNYGGLGGSVAGVVGSGTSGVYAVNSSNSAINATLATSSYAGDFSSDIRVKGDVKREYVSGSPKNAVPVAYGTVNSNATVAAGSGNFTVSYNSTNNWYEITITDESYHYLSHTTVANTVGATAPRFATTSSVSGRLIVSIFDLTGTRQSNMFNFVVFRQ